MVFGVREICNVVFRAKQTMKIGTATFKAGQPVLYMDSAKTSSLEGAATTVYAQGGRGNTRLIAWEGEKTITFTVEDALLSPISFSMLSGAGVVKGTGEDLVHVHKTTRQTIDTDGSENLIVDLTAALEGDEVICKTAPIFVMKVDADGALTGETLTATVETGDKKLKISGGGASAGDAVMVDYYVLHKSANVTELQIDAEKFGGNFYIEADTLFRGKDTKDYPANFTIPNAKIQSNFTFSMASTGDPSTFTFTMDAMPDYTYFNPNKKVLAVIQVIEDASGSESNYESVMAHNTSEKVQIEGGEFNDSVIAG